MSTLPNVTKLTLGPVLTTANGSKQIQISKDDGTPLIWTPSEYLEVAFEPSNFSDKESSRLSICFAPTEEILSNFQGIFETWCIKTLANTSKELLGSEQTEAQIKEKFQPCVKTSEKGWTSFRCKMNMARMRFNVGLQKKWNARYHLVGEIAKFYHSFISIASI